MSAVKEALHAIADLLPETATYKDAMYELRFKQKLEEALEDEKHGRIVSHEEVKKRFLG